MRRERKRVRDEVECLFTGMFGSSRSHPWNQWLCLNFIYTRVLYLYRVQNIFVLRLSFLSLLQRLVEIGANCYMVRRPSFILVSVMIGHNNKLTAIHA